MPGRHLETESEIDALLALTKRVAVLGIKTEAQADQPAFYVAKYLVDAGLDVVPVPVYYPNVTTILGKPVHRRLADIVGDIDLVDVFQGVAHRDGRRRGGRTRVRPARRWTRARRHVRWNVGLVRARRRAGRLRPREREGRAALLGPGAKAGTAFDGTHLYQVAGDEITVVDPKDGRIVRKLPAPAKRMNSGMACVDGYGAFWCGGNKGTLRIVRRKAS